MEFFKINVLTEEFLEWVATVRSNFEIMLDTMIKVAYEIEKHTSPLVPWKTGNLYHSFKYTVMENSSNFIELEIGYDASDPKSGFVYAEYQHDNYFKHPIQGTHMYLYKGINNSNSLFKIIETDYLSLFSGRL